MKKIAPVKDGSTGLTPAADTPPPSAPDPGLPASANELGFSGSFSDRVKIFLFAATTFPVPR